MNTSSNEKINLRIILLNVCPFIIITVFFFFGYIQDILMLPVIIWLTSVNYRSFEKNHLFIIIQAIMLGLLAVSNSIRALLYHFIISDDYESLWLIQSFTRSEAVFLIILTLIFLFIKALFKRKPGFIKVKYLGFYPLGSDIVVKNIKIMQETWNKYDSPLIIAGKKKEVNPLFGQVFYVTKGKESIFFVAMEYGLCHYHIFTINNKAQKRLAKKIKPTYINTTKKNIFTTMTLLTPSGKIVVPAKIEYDEDENIANSLSKITIVYKETEYKGFGTEHTWEETFANLQRKLPSNVKLACCMTCRHGNMCPYGNSENELFCLKNMVVSPESLYDIFDKELISNKDEYEKHIVTSCGYCDDFVYQSDDYYTYNDYLYYLHKHVHRDEAYYFKILLSNGFTDGYEEWLNSYLEAQDKLSDIVLNLSFCGNDMNSTVSYLDIYCKEREFDEEHVCRLLRKFLKKGYSEKRFSKEEVCNLMYHFSMAHEDPGGFSAIWGDMFYMNYYLSFAQDSSISMEKFDKAFHSYLYYGTTIKQKGLFDFK